MDKIEEATLLGAALIEAQKLEFALYGIAVHLKPEFLTNKRLKNIDPEAFLRGDPNNLKVTFGQLKKEIGDLLCLSSEDFDKLVEDRNLLAHNYWRLSQSGIHDAHKIENPKAFLVTFQLDCRRWNSILSGLLAVMLKKVATANNCLDTLDLSDKQIADIEIYYNHATKNI